MSVTRNLSSKPWSDITDSAAPASANKGVMQGKDLCLSSVHSALVCPNKLNSLRHNLV